MSLCTWYEWYLSNLFSCSQLHHTLPHLFHFYIKCIPDMYALKEQEVEPRSIEVSRRTYSYSMMACPLTVGNIITHSSSRIRNFTFQITCKTCHLDLNQGLVELCDYRWRRVGLPLQCIIVVWATRGGYFLSISNDGGSCYLMGFAMNSNFISSLSHNVYHLSLPIFTILKQSKARICWFGPHTERYVNFLLILCTLKYKDK